MARWRLLDHGDGPPAWNMAVDQVLLQSHALAGGPPTLRFYRWGEACLSLGAGQRRGVPETLAACRELGLAWVRRPTGGRAVLHGGDLTYALVAGRREGLPAAIRAVYALICRGLRAGLARLGLDLEEACGSTPDPGGLLCFGYCGPGDLTWQGRKFLGSSQCWQGESFLQHGSLLLEPLTPLWDRLAEKMGPAGPAVVSLEEMLGRQIRPAELKAAMRQGLEEALGAQFAPAGLTPWEKARLPVGPHMCYSPDRGRAAGGLPRT